MSGLCRGRTNTIWTIDDVDGNEDKNVDDNHDDAVDGNDEDYDNGEEREFEASRLQGEILRRDHGKFFGRKKGQNADL